MANLAEETVKAIQAQLEHDTRINLHHYPIRVGVENNTIVLEGKIENIAAKRIANACAHRCAGGGAVDDRLRIAVPDQDRCRLRDEVVHLLEGEPVFRNSSLYLRESGHLEVLRAVFSEGEEPSHIEIQVHDGTVRLSGTVISLSHRRMAEVLAWWAAGCERVENQLHVVPPERETDDELVDAIRLVLEKDPLVHAEQFQATARHGTVTLEGCTASEEERTLAVLDTWYVPGVHEVVDHIQVAR